MRLAGINPSGVFVEWIPSEAWSDCGFIPMAMVVCPRFPDPPFVAVCMEKPCKLVSIHVGEKSFTGFRMMWEHVYA